MENENDLFTPEQIAQFEADKQTEEDQKFRKLVKFLIKNETATRLYDLIEAFENDLPNLFHYLALLTRVKKLINYDAPNIAIWNDRSRAKEVLEDLLGVTKDDIEFLKREGEFAKRFGIDIEAWEKINDPNAK